MNNMREMVGRLGAGMVNWRCQNYNLTRAVQNAFGFTHTPQDINYISEAEKYAEHLYNLFSMKS